MSDKMNAKMVAYTAVMTALVYVTTSISLKMPPPLGAWHLGDVGSFAAGILFGPVVGAFSCGVGTMLFDVWNPFWGSAFISWAPATLVIRGLMGYGLGRYRRIFGESTFYSDVAVMALSQVWKNLSYFAYDYSLRGAAAWLDIVTFFPLSAVSILVALPLLRALRNAFNAEYLAGGVVP
jgi:uncharacterized membrane protein